ncbi:metal-dependent hydrolase [Arenimonas oryziterrae]|uniref:Metal-dependent hydrolase n=1 Tax=Arenimonas oryziterrae DSM 21050 = YC6267 TaxID=1121015 RepID=A0A091BGQ0_9GAMM|nr:metal-dependent hydrolase [Arenimonas oryziterrae]KFN43535.1 hypothetical protein N789_09680 [Arenimonas oryziterrae DSM 21050 = YC6267]
MDSLTHLFLGGAIAAAIAPAKHRRIALLAGAVINSLPDLDVIPLALFADDPIVNMTWHRSVTHSLLVLPLVAALLSAWLRSWWTPVREEPRRWFWLVLITLLAHPLIDAFTSYGTQLFWPLPVPTAMWSSLFIIDPMFTLPLVLACFFGWLLRERAARVALLTGLVLSGAYLGWSWIAKTRVEAAADAALASLGLQDAPRFSAPMPFNTLLWRVVVMTPDGFVEGERSLVADRGPMQFQAHASDTQAMAAVAAYPATRKLAWFSHGFLKAQVQDDRVVLSDLRMGAEPDYSFRFVVAARDGEGWRELPVEQLTWPWNARERLPGMWRRIWHAP